MKFSHTLTAFRRLIGAFQLFDRVEFKALILAILTHGRQRRKYTGEPYWFHLFSVATTIKRAGYQRELVVAALFHDSLEDPLLEVTGRVEYLKGVLNRIPGIDREHALDLVSDLTDVYIKRDYMHLKRKERKELEVKRMAKASIHSKIIKLADIIDNSQDIERHDPDFYKVYRRECRELALAIGSVDEHLYAQAMASLEI